MLFFQIPSRSTCGVCFPLSLFTQHGSTGTAHTWLLGKIRVTASLTSSSTPGEWEGAAVLVLTHAWQSIFWTSWSKASFRGLQLILAIAEWLRRASWLLLYLGCPHLVLAWLCSSALLWTCLGSPLQRNLLSPFQSGTAFSLGPGISR